MIRRQLLLLLIVLFPFSISGKNSETFFSKVKVEQDGNIFIGDSAVVSLILYATQPIGDIDINDAQLKVNGCRIRRAYFNSGRRQQITYVDQKPYYTVIGAQYVVVGMKKGKTTFPSLDVKANLYIEQETQRQGFDFFDPFSMFSQPTYKKEKKSLRTPTVKIQVTEAPTKSTEQLKKEGKTVI